MSTVNGASANGKLESTVRISRRELVELLNNSGLTEKFIRVREAAANLAYKRLTGHGFDDDDVGPLPLHEQIQRMRQRDTNLLNHMGPAASGTAINTCLARCVRAGLIKRNLLEAHGNKLTRNAYKNHRILMNDCPIEEYPKFSNVLRQFLLPRYAYLDFDTITDPRHNIDLECGYPKFITPIMYRYMYDRDDVARRVVDILPSECWNVTPNIYENEDESVTTDFEQDWQMLVEQRRMLQYMYRIDRLSGIGHYGVLLLGLDDGLDLDQPVNEPELLSGQQGTIAKETRQLLYMRPFDEYLSFIHQYETDIFNPRYGLPVYYNLIFLDMTIDAAGASIGTRLNRRVHWSRVIHVMDNPQSSLVFGIPRMQPVFNRLLDLRKIKGGSAEMFWKGAFPGYSFEVNPAFVPDEPDGTEYDREELKQQVEDYSAGLSRYFTTLGISVKSLSPQVADPSKHVTMQLQAISMALDMPHRQFMGSEEGRLASGQDKLIWNTRLKKRNTMQTEPNVIRNTLDRLIAVGAMRPPQQENVIKYGDSQYLKYICDWPDLNKPTDEDKANLALKWTQAMSQYVASGAIHLIGPEDWLVDIMGLSKEDATRIIGNVQKLPGWDKLLDVDPSQGTGQNGIRENLVTKGEGKGGTKDTRPQKRDSNQKSVEGMTS